MQLALLHRFSHPLPINTLLVLNALKDAPRSSLEQISKRTNLPETVVKVIVEKSVEAGLVEAYGNGINRCFLLSHALYHNKSQRVGYVLQKDIDKARYLELIKSLALENKYISKSDVVNLLHISDNQALYYIQKLIKNGELRAVQKGRYAKYEAI